MLGEIYRNSEPMEYQLVICKKNKQQLCQLSEAFDIKYNAQFTGIHTLTFKVPYYIMSREHKQIKNPNWDKVKGDFLILVNDEAYFWISSVTGNADDNGVLSKEVVAYSIEYLLQKKIIRSYKYDSRVLYSYTGEMADGIPLGILNYLLTQTDWTIGHIDDELISLATRKYRSFNIDEATLYDTIIMIQETFGCVFDFDRLHKKFNIYKTENIGINRGLYISEENYIKAFKQVIDNNNIITRLYCYGKDDMTFSTVNPTGETFIDDFTFFKHTDYMSQETIDALNRYEALCQEHDGEFANYLSELSTLQSEMLVLQTELSTLKNEKTMIEDSMDIAMKNGDTEKYASLVSQLEVKNTEIAAKEADIDTKNKEIAMVQNNIGALKELLSRTHNFTPEQLAEIEECIRFGTWSDTRYIDEKDLYEDGLKHLSEVSQPPLDFDCDVVDFLSVVECKRDWDKLVLGDKVYIHYDEFDVDLEVRLLAYEHVTKSDNNSLKLTFSNKNTLDTDDLIAIMNQSKTTSNIVERKMEEWNHAVSLSTEIDNILADNWNAAVREVIGGANEDVTFGRRGIVIVDRDNPLKQMRITSGVIALSEDGFKTARLAITPIGISATQLIGELVASEKLILTNKAGNFIVDDLGVVIENMNLTIVRSDNLARILLDPYVGIKIQQNVNGTYVDRIYLDDKGNVRAESFSINNKDTKLDENGLEVDNGKIIIKNTDGDIVFNVDTDGNLNYNGFLVSPYVTIDKLGLTISHSTSNTKTVMNPESVSVIDISTDEPVAYLGKNASFETVRSNNFLSQFPLFENRTWIYVDSIIGDDVMGDGTAESPYRSITGALNNLGKILTQKITMLVLRGVFYEDVYISGIMGVGTLRIDFSNATIYGSITMEGCSCYVFILGTENVHGNIVSTGTDQPLNIRNCSLVHVGYMDIDGKNISSSTVNIYASKVKLLNSVIKGGNGYGVYATMANVYISNCSGTNVGYGVFAGMCSIFSIEISIPIGTLANSITDGKAIIYGTANGESNNSTPANTSYKNVTYNVISTNSYRRVDGWYSNGRPKADAVYQGVWNSANGLYKGFFFFGNQFNNLVGKNITNATITIKRRGAGGYSSEQPVYFYTHNYESQPTGEPTLGTNLGSLYKLAWNESATITLPKTFLDGVKAGTTKGLAIYTSSTSKSNYVTLCGLSEYTTSITFTYQV